MSNLNKKLPVWLVPVFAMGVVAVILLELYTARLPKQTTSPTTQQDSQVQIPNPLVKHKTIEELETAVDFTVNVPTYLPQGYVADSFTAIGGSLAQIEYLSGSDSITFRMALGGEDISGDFNKYSTVTNTDGVGKALTLKGEGETVSVVTFTEGDSTYSLTFGSGIAKSEAIKIAESVSMPR